MSSQSLEERRCREDPVEDARLSYVGARGRGIVMRGGLPEVARRLTRGGRVVTGRDAVRTKGTFGHSVSKDRTGF